ncbi:MAG: hypothetical protein OEZ02_05025 [Anaerolineae bacterium]|nr:hypothetical protein [Anaerolineae bacterium]
MGPSGNWKTRTLVLGAIIGTVTGIGAAYLLVQRAERNRNESALTSGEGLRLGVLVLGLLRSIAQLGEDN